MNTSHRSPRACALDRYRKRRKTKTSSGASDEAPERARKDTPKEAKLHYEGSHPSLCVFPVKFLRLPSDASQVRGSDPAREIYLPPRSGDAPFRFGRQYYTIKSDLRAELIGRKWRGGVTRFSCRGNRSLAIFFGARQRIPLARGLLPCNERTRPTDLTLARFAAEAMP